jgi:glycosyltransferase involved in cell wall biosynthesis
MKHKLLVDAISLLSPLTGIGRYTYEISKRLQNDESFESNFFYGYYSEKLIKPSNKSELKNLKAIIVKNQLIKKFVRKLLFTCSRIFAKTYDIYWQPNFVPNSGIKAYKIVISVHDFSFILHSDFHPKERIEYLEKYFFINIKKSDMIITGSEFSKREILEHLNFYNEQVQVIYHGIDHKLFKLYNDATVDFQLPKRFIFSVGSIEPRKNLIGLLKSYNSLADKFKGKYKLVLAGFKGWENSEIMELIKKNKDNIVYLGFISDIELAKVYNLASLFVFPSFYEGFGLPVLESMACGTPVVCSDTTSLPEVGGDAVVYCDPNNVNDIAEKMEIVLSDEKLQQEMIGEGLKRAKQFTWEKSAEEHMRIFKEVLRS